MSASTTHRIVFIRIGIVKPYESCDGKVGWTVQELDEEGEETGAIIAECRTKKLATHLLKWILKDRMRCTGGNK